MKKDASYGIIPCLKTPEGEWEFLLIYQKEQFRGFPKGHLENQETPLQAAIRELREETGIPNCEILDPKSPLVLQYQFRETGGELIEKTASFYLGLLDAEAKSQLQIDNYEVIDFVRLPYAQARNQLTHQSSQELLDQAYHILTSGAKSL